ncbi:MAG: hypothetical protein J5702_07890, partial [Bacteroidales bacterium]|nr:hypothetical protein [Bacteroidales bacterium]
MKALSHSLRFAGLLLALTALTACAAKRPMTNLALRSPAYHSTSIDYNVTAQLAVDGIVETEPACWVEICGNGGTPLSKREHDLVLDPRIWTSVSAEGPQAELSLRTHGFTEPVDRVTAALSAVLPEGVRQTPYSAQLQCLDTSGEWTVVKEFRGTSAGRGIALAWDAPQPVAPEGWRIVAD